MIPLSQSPRNARIWHGLTALVALGALVLQISLVIDGSSVLVDGPVPNTSTRVFRYFTYFTIQSNFLVLFTTATLAARPARDGRVWRIVRLDAVVGITVTGLIHFFFLRPLLDLHRGSYLADKLLHVAVPLLAVTGWVVFGPRRRVTRRDLLPAMAWPAAYIAFTVVHGAISGWYPYPFTDVTTQGYLRVSINGVLVAVLLYGLCVLARWADRQLPSGDLDGQDATSPDSDRSVSR